MSKYKVPTIKELIEAGVHFGHQVRRWHPKMEKYIFSVNKNVHIIDLEQTEALLKTACEFLYETAKKGKVIIFVGTKRQSKEIIEIEAKRSGAMYVTERWIGGTVTNFKTIKKNLDKLIEYMKGRQEGAYDKYTKRERLEIDRKIAKMTLAYGGVINLKGTPGALFVIDPKRERTAIHEARGMGIPTVAIVDTNADPSTVDYVIPGNDDAIKSVASMVKAIADSIEEGYKEFAKLSEKAEEPVTAPVVEEVKVEEVKPLIVTADESVIKVEKVEEALKEEKKEIVNEAPKKKTKLKKE